MELLSSEPVADDYVVRLCADMDRAVAIRFAVAYVSAEGVSAIGRDRLVKLLHHPLSFGVATMACGCGCEPFLELSARLPRHLGPRLRYFMEPHASSSAGPDIDLMHTKMVLLVRDDGAGIIYIGSHNWSGRALGAPGNSRRNAEASVRMEMHLDSDDLSGRGSGFSSQVNRHLMACFNLPISLDATEDNRAPLEEWMSRVCWRNSAESLTSVAVVLATCDTQSTAAASRASYWRQLRARGGIYLQILREEEGNLVWAYDDKVVLLVWSSPGDLQRARQPVILFCRATHKNAGRRSRRAGTSLGGTEISGFCASVWDPHQVANAKANGGRLPPLVPDMSVAVPSGRRVHHFLFEQRATVSKAGDVDDTVLPLYQVYFEIDHVIVPSWIAREPDEEFLRWTPDAVGFSSSKKARVENSPGYRVSREREKAILQCLGDVFGVDLDRMKVRPYSYELPSWAGLRLAEHPVHEAYIGPEVLQEDREFYGRARRERSSLVPHVFVEPRMLGSGQVTTLPSVPRVFSAYMTQLGTLLEELLRRQGGQADV